MGNLGDFPNFPLRKVHKIASFDEISEGVKLKTMKQETKELNKLEKGFNLIDSFDIIDNIPPPFKKVKEDKKQIIEFFDKIPENKVMRIKFPTESLWTTYYGAFRYYASDYPFNMQFNKRKDEGGYYLYIKKFEKMEAKDGKDMEVKSI